SSGFQIRRSWVRAPQPLPLSTRNKMATDEEVEKKTEGEDEAEEAEAKDESRPSPEESKEAGDESKEDEEESKEEESKDDETKDELAKADGDAPMPTQLGHKR